MLLKNFSRPKSPVVKARPRENNEHNPKDTSARG
jgi:hypothetical protein